MKAMVLARTADVGTDPLQLRQLPMPEPGPGEILVRITVCGVCRTDLHVIEGELSNPALPLIPGHQAVGVVSQLGPGEILVRITVCGVCRTDLHVIEGELSNPALPLIPGHQAVGVVSQVGPG